MILAQAVEFEGRGLHGGRDARVQILPSRPGSGLSVIFDGHARPIVSLEMSGRDRSTVLRDPASGRELGSVEHLLAALAGLDVWDATIASEGDEVPVLDGSALPFARGLRAAMEQGPAPAALVPSSSVRVEGGDAWIEAEPSDRLTLEVAVDFPHPRVGAQRLVWSKVDGSFLEDLSPARTFGFLAELPQLRARGLAAGGGLDCALVFGPDGVLNPEGARFADEPVRHKMLDLVGDLALVGRPVRMRVMAKKPSHELNHALVRMLRLCCHDGGGRGKVDQ
ncbi:MAG: UDP-3-O-[3-hydroxymyristoyl] N-acetylglucosamine deacetylase [Deltaproteobacteria bacterium]|nr:UDP-3-O-[3-hydroxymyristoyl] N-acetylglucosamine deacetylase [Deltaproteobacteria bacterium]